MSSPHTLHWYINPSASYQTKFSVDSYLRDMAAASMMGKLGFATVHKMELESTV